MRDLEADVLSSLSTWLDQGMDAWLCTVVATYGSSPRPPGAMMVYCKRGDRCGSLSGGCVEEDLLDRLAAGEFQGRSSMVVYGDTDAGRWGLPCGGIMRVHVLHLRSEDADRYRWVSGSLERRERIQRLLDLHSGTECYSSAAEVIAPIITEHQLSYTLGPSVRMLLVGVNPVSAYVAQMGQLLGFDVIVCDPDPLRLKAWTGPSVMFSREMPDDAVRRWACDKDSVVLALSHDPKLDDMALMEALSGPSFYVGAMGSERSSSKRRERLRQLELTEAEISRLSAPVGIDIGSKTPAEIALSVLADVVLHRNRRQPL